MGVIPAGTQNIFLLGIVVLLTTPSELRAATTVAPSNGDEAFYGKTVIEPHYPPTLEIPLPDGGFYELGNNLRDSLNTALTESGRFIVLDESASVERRDLGLAQVRSKRTFNAGWEWASVPVASSQIDIRVREVSFRTGARGDRTLYGWDERMQDPFSSHPEEGIQPGTNEFPARNPSQNAENGRGSIVRYFDRNFEANDTNSFWGTYSGLDLSEGLSLNFLLAYMRIVVRSFKARVVLELTATEGASGESQTIQVPTEASGFHFDIAGGYMGYEGAVTASRKDAMIRSVNEAVQLSSVEVQKLLRRSTRLAKIDGITLDPSTREVFVLLGTGAYSAIPAGTVYRSQSSAYAVEVTALPTSSGSVAKVLTPDLPAPQVGELLVEVRPQETFRDVLRTLASVEEGGSGDASTPPISRKTGVKLPRFDFEDIGVRELSDVTLFLKSLAEAVFLPYRIYRWWMYDQSYHKNADFALESGGAHSSLRRWVAQAQSSDWGRAIGLNQVKSVPDLAVRNPVVAMIDTGVDYNHPVLHDVIQVDATAPADRWAQKSRIGWDFYAGDSKPFDENDHGTELASLVVAVAPHAKVLPIKAFNAWGMTSSQAIYSSIHYALSQGADVILLGWSTQIPSRALRLGIRAAQEAGVPVISAAGDLGIALDAGFQQSYPAGFASEFDLLLPVVASDAAGMRLGEGDSNPRSLRSNYGPQSLRISAPGQDLAVAQPRARAGKGRGSAYSAALVAGALARIASFEKAPVSLQERSDLARGWIQELLQNSRSQTKMERSVEKGRTLWISR